AALGLVGQRRVGGLRWFTSTGAASSLAALALAAAAPLRFGRGRLLTVGQEIELFLGQGPLQRERVNRSSLPKLRDAPGAVKKAGDPAPHNRAVPPDRPWGRAVILFRVAWRRQGNRS